jgi:hypothetical protein
VRSPMHASQQAAGLEKRLSHAETTLMALTPPRLTSRTPLETIHVFFKSILSTHSHTQQCYVVVA